MQFAVGCVVEVAAEDDWQVFVFCEQFIKLRLAEQPFALVPRVVEVRAGEQQSPLANVEHGLQDAARFTIASLLEHMVFVRLNRVFAEDGGAVFATLKIEVGPECHVHVGSLGQLGCHVDATGALRVLVDLLQGDRVGVRVRDDFGDTVEIDLPIQPLPVMDVIGHNAENDRRDLGWLAAGEGEQGKDDQRQAKRNPTPALGQAGWFGFFFGDRNVPAPFPDSRARPSGVKKGRRHFLWQPTFSSEK